MDNKFSLEGKKAFVTGGAQGIGEAVALAFAEYGADVAIVDMNLDLAEETAKRIREKGVKSIAVKCNVTSPSDVDSMMKTVLDSFGEINIAFNNAGIVTRKQGVFFTAEDMPFEDWKAVIDVNLHGVFLTAQAAGRAMIKQGKGGSIINTASMSAHIVNHQTYCNYNTSKAAVMMLTKCFASEWVKYGIRVNSLSPGNVNTPLAKYCSKELVDFLNNLTPMNRFCEPDELTGICIYLASDASSYTTGADMLVDGGYTIW